MREINLPRLDNIQEFSMRSRERIVYLYLHEALKEVFASYIKAGDNILDIGCGNKPYEEYIHKLTNKRGIKYVGCDIIQSSEQKVDIICEATNIPEPSATYDIILCTQVIEHVFDHYKIFEEAYRLLKPGGFFIVSAPFIWHMHEIPYDFYRFTRYGIQELLTHAGFRIKEEKSNGGKFAVLGQLIIHICDVPHCPQSGFFKRKFNTFIRIAIRLFCNWLFPLLDNKTGDNSQYTLNYVFVGKK
jgi:SAM-dependent methyltransferase